jgi:hypothetical protein
LFNKNKSKGQTSIEILAILGVLVIGGIILGTFYLQNINKKTAEATEIANLDYNYLIGDLNEPTYSSLCGNGTLDAGEECDDSLFGGKTCATEGYSGGGSLTCNNCQISTLNCLKEFMITASSGPNGSVTPAGVTYYSQNANQTYSITPDATYEIDTLTVDGASQAPVAAYPFTGIDSNHTISATFKKSSSLPNVYTIDSKDGPNCGISPLGPTDVNEGDNQSYLITPDVGYEIDVLTVDGTEVVSPTTTYDFINVKSNHTISVTCRVESTELYYYIFAFSMPAIGGSISPVGSVQVAAGNDQTFVITSNPGYHVGELRVDGTPQAFGHLGNSYTFYDVDRNHSIFATFVANTGQTYTLTYSAEAHGTISGVSPQVVNKGDSGSSVTAVPDTGYDFNQWSDGLVQNPRTDTNVQGNITVAASFMPNAPEPIEISVSPAIGSATINTDFNVDVNTIANASSLRYTLKVDFTDNVTGVSTSNCSYNGVYASSITLGTNLSPSVLSYTPFSCNTTGTYIFRFTATNDSNAANFAFSDSTWTINNTGTVATPVASLNTGTYYNDQSVTLSCSTPGAIIHYTLDGTDANCSSPLTYEEGIPISITSSKTLKAIGCLSPMNPSGIMSKTYTLKVATPIANPVGGTINSGTYVSLSTTTSGATIRYTTNGVDPTESDTSYTVPIQVTTDVQLKSKGFKTNYNPSDVRTDNYTIDRCGILTPDEYMYDVVTHVCSNPVPTFIKQTTCTNNLASLNTVDYYQVWVGPSPAYDTTIQLFKSTDVAEFFCEQHGLTTFVGGTWITTLHYRLNSAVCSDSTTQFYDYSHSDSARWNTIICTNGGTPKAATPTSSYSNPNVIFTSPTVGATICYSQSVGGTPVEPVIWVSGTPYCSESEYTAPIWINQSINFKARTIMINTDPAQSTGTYAINGWVESDLLTVTYP